MGRLLRATLGIIFAVAGGVAWIVPASASALTTVTVGPGQSIQAAVDAAEPGTTIVLLPGVYRQNVLVSKDGITLQGAGPDTSGTVLEPPATPPTGECVLSGVCVLAKEFDHSGRVRVPVSDVQVAGIMFSGWNGDGVIALGSENLRLVDDAAVGNGNYGFARFESSGGAILDVTATGNGEAGIYVGDSPAANAQITDSRSWGNSYGILIRHARQVQVTGNDFRGNCEGILVLDDGQPGGVGDVTLDDNVVAENNQACGDEVPPLGGGGILLVGATDSAVTSNTVLGNQGSQATSGGIVLLDAGPITHGRDLASDVVSGNVAFGNQPADIRWDGTGVDIVFAGNACANSVPTGLCAVSNVQPNGKLQPR